MIRSLLEDKRLVLLLSLLAMGALVALAVGLGNVPFRDAQPFGREEARGVASIPVQAAAAFVEMPAWMHLGMWGLFILMVVLIAALVSPEMRWRLIKNLIRVAVIYWGFYIFITRFRERLAQIALDLNLTGGDSLSDANGELLPAFAPPSASSSFVYLASFIVALLLVVIAWRLFVFWQKHRSERALPPLEKIAKIARASLHDISAGRDTTDAIMNCYYRMSDVVAEKRKLERDSAMTPAEFAVKLEHAGLPGEAVGRLTRLFENVRYGKRRADMAEVNEAVACLTTILHHCGEAA